VLEGIHLIAADRSFGLVGTKLLLFEVLNQIDGLGDDVDAELEAAIAATEGPTATYVREVVRCAALRVALELPSGALQVDDAPSWVVSRSPMPNPRSPLGTHSLPVHRCGSDNGPCFGDVWAPPVGRSRSGQSRRSGAVGPFFRPSIQQFQGKKAVITVPGAVHPVPEPKKIAVPGRKYHIRRQFSGTLVTKLPQVRRDASEQG
jgi:hypothetical protein